MIDRSRDHRGFRAAPTPQRGAPVPPLEVELITARRPFRVYYVRSSSDGYVDVPAGARLELNESRGALLDVSSAELGLEHALVDADNFDERPLDQADSDVDATWTRSAPSPSATGATSDDGTTPPCESSTPSRLSSGSTSFSQSSRALLSSTGSKRNGARLNGRDRRAALNRLLAGEPVEVRFTPDLKRAMAERGLDPAEVEVELTDHTIRLVRVGS